MDFERALVSEVILTGDIKPVTDSRLTADFFTDDTDRKVFKMILDHHLAHGKVPDETVIHAAYPNYEVEGFPEPLEFYVKAVRDRHLKRILMDGLTEMDFSTYGDGIDGGERLFADLAELVVSSRAETPVGNDIDLFHTAWEYLHPQLTARRTLGAVQGVPTGFDSLDIATGGLQPERLITLVGIPKSGKSSMVLKMALNAAMSGRRVLFVTFEMSNEEQIDRTASLLGKLPLTSVLTGNLVPKEMAELERAFTMRKGLTGFFTLAHDRLSMMTLSGVQAKISEYHPDIVVVDGAYMMDDESGEPPMTPRALTNITRGLKRMAQANKLPILISTQALEHKSRGGLTSNSVGYSSSFAQDSDTLVGVESYAEQPELSEIKVILSRSGPKKDFFVRIGWDVGVIEEIDTALVGTSFDAPVSSNGGRIYAA